jgi:hypothetical protein
MQYVSRREQGYLIVRLSGAPSEQEVRDMLRSLLSETADTRGMIVEVEVEFGLGLTSTKNLVSSLPAIGFAPDYRIALLLLNEASRKSARFAEDVAVNRGIALRVFSERDGALRWLAET